MIDYLLKFPSKQIAEEFGVANGFAIVDDEGITQNIMATHTYAIHEIGEHNGKDFWVLFRDLVGIPIPKDGKKFIVWSSDMTVVDDADDEIPIPRPEFNPNIPSVFWAE
jgi:hypothetical protein